MNELIRELKIKIVETLSLVDVNPETMADDIPLFQEGLGLDSIDVLELVIMVEKDYGVKIDNKDLGQKVFRPPKTLAEYITEQRGKSA